MTSDADTYLQNLGARHRPRNVSLSGEALEFLNLSFSLNGEDLMIRQRFKRELHAGKEGTYVDIGAFHPFLASNSYLFYAAGWSGVCIDPNPVLEGPYRHFRPRDVFVSAAVTEDPKEVCFAEHRENTGMSSIFEHESDIPDGFAAPIAVQGRRLDEILRLHMADRSEIDFMSLDTEQTELSALRSNDWSKFRPKILCVELHETGLNDVGQSDLVKFMKTVDYAAYAFAPPNVFFEDRSYQPMP